METTKLFIPVGYGTGTIIRDLEGKMWKVGKALIAPIHEVHPIDKMVAEQLLKDPKQKLLVST